MFRKSHETTRYEFITAIRMKAVKDKAFLNELRKNPSLAIRKYFNCHLPEKINFKLLEEDGKVHYLVLPQNPEKHLNHHFDVLMLAVMASGTNTLYRRPIEHFLTAIPVPHLHKDFDIIETRATISKKAASESGLEETEEALLEIEAGGAMEAGSHSMHHHEGHVSSRMEGFGL
jgi:hypothetical protein